MPTFKGVILKHRKREDNTFNVKIRVTHNRESVYLGTDYYVSTKQLSKDLEIKDPFVNERINDKLKMFRQTILELGPKTELYNANDLANYLERVNSMSGDGQINFISFGNQHIEKLRKAKRMRYADSIQTTLNSIVSFTNSKNVPITDITAKFLKKYEDYLINDRKIKVAGNKGQEILMDKPGLSPLGVINYMTNIRTLFNAARQEFNDEDTNEIRITHYPFKKYKIGAAPITKKRALKPEVIKSIKNMSDLKVHGSHNTNRSTLGRDVFMLSFYLVGMNTVDIYQIDEYENGRITYNRSKTKNRRSDNALISIKVEPEAEALMEKYKDSNGERVFNFYKLYKDEQSFNKAVNMGLKQVSTFLKMAEPITFYYARHSWATIARNNCKVSKDDIGLALNHSDPQHKVTDTYLEKDWTIIDEANKKVIKLIL